MIKNPRSSLYLFGIGIVACLRFAHADPIMADPSKNDKSPSRDQVLWTQTDLAYDFTSEYDYVGGARQDLGNGSSGHVDENYTDVRQIWTKRTMLAFLSYGGLEWEQMQFNVNNKDHLPPQLHAITAYLATDFRWSDHDMMRVQVQPGFYTDLEDVDLRSVNIPFAIAYTHIPSRQFQWAFGLSINTWRRETVLPGGGFRYAINDRWHLKFMLPNPQVEYKVNDYLHAWVGADLRGNTYRVNSHYGTDRGDPALNNAIVDYSEIRVGTGFSWNIKPLLELNGEAGYMQQRSFDFYHSDFTSTGESAPYISLTLRWLFQLSKDERPMNDQIRAMQVEFPSLKNLFKLP